jgi:hypothetical protein
MVLSMEPEINVSSIGDMHNVTTLKETVNKLGIIGTNQRQIDYKKISLVNSIICKTAYTSATKIYWLRHRLGHINLSCHAVLRWLTSSNLALVQRVGEYPPTEDNRQVACANTDLKHSGDAKWTVWFQAIIVLGKNGLLTSLCGLENSECTCCHVRTGIWSYLEKKQQQQQKQLQITTKCFIWLHMTPVTLLVNLTV